MLLAGRVIGPLTGMVIAGLAGGMADIRVDMLTEVCMTVVVVAVITLEGVAPDIGVSADVDANMWVTMIAVLELITLPVPLEELLLFCWTAFRCWSIAVLGCLALQAWMPSCHVC
jgi:hypothetical protein